MEPVVENSERRHTIRWGEAGFASVETRPENTLDDDANALANLSVAADKAHRILNGTGIRITEVDGHQTEIPVQPPDQPDPARIKALLKSESHDE